MQHPKAVRGFTLIELMVVVTIVGLLLTLAIPAYSGYIARSQRADARTTLLQAAQFMQRFYAANDNFKETRSSPAVPVSTEMPAMLKKSPANGTAIYELTVIDATEDAYTLTMAPVAGGRMGTDPCGSYVVTSLGRSINIKGGTELPVEERNACWK